MSRTFFRKFQINRRFLTLYDVGDEIYYCTTTSSLDTIHKNPVDF